MGPGIWVIIILVILIILACIGYFIWQKFFRKSEQPQQTKDAEKGDKKGNYEAAPTSDKP